MNPFADQNDGLCHSTDSGAYGEPAPNLSANNNSIFLENEMTISSSGRRRISGNLIVVFLCAAMLTGHAFAQTESPSLPRPAKLIDIIAQDRTQTVTLPAIVEPSLSVDLTVQVSGVLVEFPVQEGQQVKKGDLIAQIDKGTYQNAVDQAQAQYENAQEEFKRADTLIKQQAISQSVFEQRKSTRDVSKLALAAAQTQLSDSTLTAPFDGIVSNVNVKQYQTVTQQSPIVTLQGRSEFEAIANVPAQTVASSADLSIEKTTLVLDVAPLQTIPVVFKQIAPQADPASQTFEVKFTFTPPEGLVILGGMTGELSSTIHQTGAEAKKNAIQVPISSILYDGTETYVWLVDTGAMTVAKTKVTVAKGIGGVLPVTEGLSVGDTIVGAGASYLHEGMKIRRYKP